MSSKSVPTEIVPGSLLDVDPVALGRAGLDALAVAGTAVVAHYALSECDLSAPTGPGDERDTSQLPEEVGRVLTHALAAFGADPPRQGDEGIELAGPPPSTQVAALTAMSQRAFDVAARRSFDCG